MKNIIFFFKSLDKRYKAASILVIIILFINALFEMLSIGILYPFVSMLIDSGQKFESDFDNEIFSFLSPYINEDFSINKILYIISFIFILKFLLNVASIYIQNKYSFSLLQNLSYKLFSSYVSRNYMDLSKENTSFLVRNLTYNLNTFVNGLNSFINILAEFLIVSSITFLLLLINLKITTTILIFFCSLCEFLFLTKLQVNKLAVKV